MVYTGQDEYRIDPSRRVMLPGRWRSEEKGFWVVPWPLGKRDCLMVVPAPRFQKTLEALSGKSLSDKAALAVQRVIGGTHHGPPVVARIFFEQQNFKRAAAPRVHRAQPRGDHARVVEHEHVAVPKKIQKVAKCFLFESRISAMQHEQSRGVAHGRGMLRDEFGRQMKIKIRDAHAPLFLSVNNL